MILAIDIGNTTVGLGGIRHGETGYEVLFSGKLETNREWGGAKYTEEFDRWMTERNFPRDEVEGAALSSVVPTVQAAMEEAVKTLLGLETMVITYESDLGITVDVENPEKVGRDRLVDSAWAAANYPLPVLTADLGTATTFNVVSEDRRFCGGVIAAGILTGLRALASRTAQLPALELKKPEHIVGRNTAECMMSGAVAGTAAILDGIAADIEEELGKEVSFVITGGGAPYAEYLVRHKHFYEPDMMLLGLAYLYERNK